TFAALRMEQQFSHLRCAEIKKLHLRQRCAAFSDICGDAQWFFQKHAKYDMILSIKRLFLVLLFFGFRKISSVAPPCPLVANDAAVLTGTQFDVSSVPLRVLCGSKLFWAEKTQWSGRADLNCRPLAPQASALPG